MCVCAGGKSFCRYTFNTHFFPSLFAEETEEDATSVSSLDYNFISNSFSILKIDGIYAFKINSEKPFIILLVLTSLILI